MMRIRQALCRMARRCMLFITCRADRVNQFVSWTCGWGEGAGQTCRRRVVGMDTYLLRGPQELLPLRLHLMDDAVPCGCTYSCGWIACDVGGKDGTLQASSLLFFTYVFGLAHHPP